MPLKDPEARKEYHRQHYLNNKEKIAEQRKEYHLKNKEKRNQQRKEYLQTESGIKSTRIGNWKARKVITDDWNALYDHYLKTSFCDFCKIKLSYDKHMTATTKCLDHDHTITDRPNFRNILCHPCNIKRRAKKTSQTKSCPIYLVGED